MDRVDCGTYLINADEEDLICTADHNFPVGIRCLGCGAATCLQCAGLATAPTLTDLDPIIVWLDRKPPEERNVARFTCTGCWDGNDEPPSLSHALFRSGCPMPPGHDGTQVHWLADASRVYRSELAKRRRGATDADETEEADRDETEEADGEETKTLVVSGGDGAETVAAETPQAGGYTKDPPRGAFGQLLQTDRKDDASVYPPLKDLVPRPNPFDTIADTHKHDTINTNTTPVPKPLTTKAETKEGPEMNNTNATQRMPADTQHMMAPMQHMQHTPPHMTGLPYMPPTQPPAPLTQQYTATAHTGGHNVLTSLPASSNVPAPYAVPTSLTTHTYPTGAGYPPYNMTAYHPHNMATSQGYHMMGMLPQQGTMNMMTASSMAPTMPMTMGQYVPSSMHPTMTNTGQPNPSMIATMPPHPPVFTPAFSQMPSQHQMLPQPQSPTPSASAELLQLLQGVAQASNSRATVRSNGPKIKMKPIELGSFDGNKLNYRTFIKWMDYHFDRNGQLSDADKVAILRGHLTGRAADKIADLEDIDDGAYGDARAILEESYGGEETNKQDLTELYLSIPAEGRYESAAMEKLADKIRLTVSKCRRGGVSEGFLQDTAPSLLNKVPPKVRQKVNSQQAKDGSTLTVDTVIRALRKHAGLAEKEEKAVQSQSKTERYKPNRNSQSETLYTGYYLSQGSEDMGGGSGDERRVSWEDTHNLVQASQGQTKKTPGRPQRPRSPTPNRNKSPVRRGPDGTPWRPRSYEHRPCAYCGDQHNEFDCPKTLQERVDEVNKKRLCPNCLRKGHKATACGMRFRCKKCDARHHTSLCKIPDEEIAESNNLAQNMKSGDTIMPYFKTEASNPVNGEVIQITALVDQGSTNTFITEAAAKKLRLAELGHRTFASGTCLTEERRVVKAKRVELDLHTKTGQKMRVEALAVPTIVADITVKPALLSFSAHSFLSHQTHICNAPPEKPTVTEIQLLLGNGVYGQIMKPATSCKALDIQQNFSPTKPPSG